MSNTSVLKLITGAQGPAGPAGSGGGVAPLLNIGGFGSNNSGTLLASCAFNTTMNFGPFAGFATDTTNLATLVAGHIYRTVWYLTGTSGGANLGLVQNPNDKGYFMGTNNLFFVNGGGYSALTTVGWGSTFTATYPTIAEIYLYVIGPSHNRIWSFGMGMWMPGADDTNVDFTAFPLQLGGNSGDVSGHPTAAYVYDLGAMVTS